MLPIPPRENLTIKCSDSVFYKDHRYIAYGSLDRVFIYDSNFNFIQKLTVDGNHEQVNTLAFNKNGKLAVGYESSIIIYIPIEEGPKDLQWSSQEIISYSNPRCVDWNNNSDEEWLLAGSKKLSIWKNKTYKLIKNDSTKEVSNESETSLTTTSLSLQENIKTNEKIYELIWEEVSAGEVSLVSFSPDGKFFATLTEFDCLVKIWYSRSVVDSDYSSIGSEEEVNTYKFDFLYLSHPRSVVSFDRRKTVEKNRKKINNILLTMCRDNICRLWAQSNDENNNYKFYMCKMIEPFCLPPSLNHTPVSEPKISYVHWIDNREIHRAIYSDSIIEKNKFQKKWRQRVNGNNNKNQKELKDIIKDNQDMLFHVSPDGTVIIWGVQNLNTYPLSIPHLVVLIKIPKAFSSSDYNFFRNPVLIYSNPASQELNALCSSPELMIVAHNSRGIMNCYEMNLYNVFLSSQEIHFRMIYSWAAHQNSINSLICHPNLPYIATSDGKSEIMIWYNNGIQAKKSLDWVTSININESGALFEWFTEGPYIYVYQDNKIYIYIITDRAIQNVLTYEMNDYPIIYMNTFSKQKSSYLYALSSKSNILFIWQVHLKENDFKIDLIYKAGVELDDCGKILKIISLSDFSSAFTYTNIPIGLFGTYTEDQCLRYWHIGDEQALFDSSEIITDNLLVKSVEKKLSDPVVFAKNSKLNTLAIVTEVDGTHKLDIFINDIYNLVIKRQYSIKLNSKVYDMDWYFTSEGQQFLAIAFEKEVHILCRTRKSEENPNYVKWEVFSKVQYPKETNEEGGEKLVKWLENGTLVYANKSMIYSIDKWVIPQNLEIVQNPRSNLLLSANDKTHRLPLYHPQHLINYILWGRYNVAKDGLNILYHYIDLMKKANREIINIPSPLWSLFEEENENVANSSKKYNFLFRTSIEEENTEDVNTFTNEKARLLTEYLYQIKLPYINKHEQMNLVGIVNILLWTTEQKMQLDENGMRYLITMKLFTYSRRFISQSAQLNFRDITWAYYSESQDVLINFCKMSCGEKFLWKDARALGLSLWIRNNNTLRHQIELIARNQYMNNGENNPYNCFIFYMAMKKLKVIVGLWKNAVWHPERAKMLTFLDHDFTEPRWQKAALKNAFALLSKRRFENAVGFFLLGDRLYDAVNVCIKQLKDIQLAITICRLYEGDESPVLKDLYINYLLPQAIDNNDRWLANHIFSFLNDSESTLESIFVPLENFRNKITSQSYSDLAGFEYYQETKPEDPILLILYQNLKDNYKSLRKPVNIKPFQEKKLIFKAINTYEIMGCPMLSLDLINKYSDTLLKTEEEEEKQFHPKEITKSFSFLSGPSSTSNNNMNSLNSGLLDWGTFGNNTNTNTNTTSNTSNNTSTSNNYDWLFTRTKASPTLDWSEYDKEKKSTLVSIDEESSIKSNNVKSSTNTSLSSINNKNVYIDQSITLLKWYLGLRAIWDGCNSIANVLENEYILVESQLFKQFIKKMHNGLKKLSKLINMPIEIINCVLIWGCNQDHSTLAFIDIFPMNGKAVDFSDIVDSIFYEKSNTLNRLLFRLSDGSDEFPGSKMNYEYITQVAKRFLITLDHWIKQLHKSSIKNFSPKMIQFAHSTYLSLLLTTVHLKDWKKLLLLVYNLKGFLNGLQNEDHRALHTIIKDIINGAEVQVNNGEEEESDDYLLSDDEMEEELRIGSKSKDYSVKERREKTETLLELITYYYIISSLEKYLLDLEKMNSDEISNYFYDFLLKPLSHMTYTFETEVKNKLEDCNTFKDSLKSYMKDKDQKKYWELLKNLTETDLIIDKLSTMNINAEKEIEGGIDKLHELILRINEPILSFTINPIDNKCVAVATAKAIYELDIENAYIYYEQKNNNGINVSGTPKSFDILNNFDSKKASQLYDDSNNQLKTSESQYSLNSAPGSPKSSISMGRNLSYDSIQKAFKRSLSGNLRNSLPNDIDFLVTLKRQALHVTCLSSHPTNNYYIASINDTQYSKSSIVLFQFGHPEPIMFYTTNDTSKIIKCCFDSYGQKFGACTGNGDLYLWNFDNAQSSSEPCQVITNDHNPINDFRFLSSSSLIAIALSSSNNDNVCIYDTLLPPSSIKVKTFSLTEENALSMAYSAQYKLLAVGSKRGDIYVFDIKNMNCLNTFQAHTLAIKSLAIDEVNDYLLSSSIEGDIKIWTLKDFTLVNTWPRVHVKQALKNHSEKSSIGKMGSIGVNELLSKDEYIYSCGSDGTLRRTHWK